MNATQAITDAAFSVLHFTKTHEFPTAGSLEFFELTSLLHELECAFIKSGISTDFRKQEPTQ